MEERPGCYRPKQNREESPQLPTEARCESPLFALRQRDGPRNRSADRVSPGKGSSTSLVSAAASDSKSQFRPGRQQRAVHGAMVNGTYSCLDDQLFVEIMQSRAKDFDYLPHPSVARGFFADFGFRGLSIRHFAPMNVKVERDNLKSYNMTFLGEKQDSRATRAKRSRRRCSGAGSAVPVGE